MNICVSTERRQRRGRPTRAQRAVPSPRSRPAAPAARRPPRTPRASSAARRPWSAGTRAGSCGGRRAPPGAGGAFRSVGGARARRRSRPLQLEARRTGWGRQDGRPRARARKHARVRSGGRRRRRTDGRLAGRTYFMRADTWDFEGFDSELDLLHQGGGPPGNRGVPTDSPPKATS